MNNGVTVDASQVLRMFSELNSRQQKNVYKNALRIIFAVSLPSASSLLISASVNVSFSFFAFSGSWTNFAKGNENTTKKRSR